MIRTLTAFTAEIDMVDQAVEEIMDQLKLEENLLANSIGILTCYSEFLDSGVVKALCAALPFHVVGCTTLANATSNGNGNLMLTLMVITADDVVFEVGLSAALGDEQENNLKSLYGSLRAELPADPVFMISFMPLMYNVGGEVFINALDAASGSVPIFGTLTVDHTTDYHEARVIMDGEVYTENLVLVAVCGNIHPTFLIESISPERTIQQQAIITDASANILKEVNGIPVMEYMQSMGLASNGKIEGATSSTMPFVVDFNDGTKPVIRAIFASTPEGYAVCGGDMPINATLSISSIDYENVMTTSAGIIERILEKQEVHGALLFSCVGRNYVLGTRTLDEMKLLSDKLSGAVPFQAAYSGGEICPLVDNDRIMKNRFHNDTIIACIF